MMVRFIVAVLLVIFSLYTSYAQLNNSYDSTLEKLRLMLIDKSPSFKDAVILTEKAYLGDLLDEAKINSEINFLINLSKAIASQNNFIIYDGKDKEKMIKYAAIFKLLTDTTFLEINNITYQKEPYLYDFNDVFGTSNWENMFVSKLLRTKKGNCHSMPFLYKILCEGNNVACQLALAPNHIYIKHQSSKGGWYNTELTSASFPIDAWLMASGFITLQAVQHGVYLDTLSDKQSIALCVIDLAQGYSKKFPDNDGDFILKCCDLALKYLPTNINVILLQTETLLSQLLSLQTKEGLKNLSDIAKIKKGKLKWDEMNRLYKTLHMFGYRQMPEEMYVDWLNLLNVERSKFHNDNIDR